jgi:hypothetical protein
MTSKPSVPSSKKSSRLSQQHDTPCGKQDIDAFVSKARDVQHNVKQAEKAGRLIFAMDATMSRQHSWDVASQIQADMFDEAASINGLAVQLVYFRGFAECRSSRFVHSGKAMTGLMEKIDCRGGRTQIEKVLKHGVKMAREQKVRAMIYVGDAMEDNIDALCHQAGQMALLGTKIFLFHEGHDRAAGEAFQTLAKMTKGGYYKFDASAPDKVRRLLRAIAAYASGGLVALESKSSREARLLLEQMR